MSGDPMDLTRGMRVPTASARRRTANRGIGAVIVGSLVLHGGALAGVVYAQSRQPRAVIGPNSIPVELVRLGKPRDPKLLPRRAARAAPPPPDEGVALDRGDTKTRTTRAKKPRRTRPEERLSDAARRMLEGTGALDRAVSRLDDVEGSPDGDPMGTTTDPSRAADAYQASVIRTMQAQYKLPETIPASQRRFLSAEVVLFIERDGSIVRFEFVKSHPNALFVGALERMLRSTKLPPPPRTLAAQYRNTGLGVRFKP